MSFDDDETVDDYPSITRQTDKIVVESFDEKLVNVGAVTHRGAVRSRNEDQYAIVRRTRASDVLSTSLNDEDLAGDREATWLLVVADGLGGQVSGQVASATAIRAVMKCGAEVSSWLMRPVGDLKEDLEERVAIYCAAINKEMQSQVEINPKLAGMATTLTSAYLYGPHAMICNVGDSRSYLIRDQNLRQITHDHTLAKELQEGGLPSEVTHAYRNVLTRCFDTSGKPSRFDMFHLDLQQNDRILLCSDGLTDMISDDEILSIIEGADSTADACEQLTQAALDNGGKDNITLILAQVVVAKTVPNGQQEESVRSRDSTLSSA